MSLHRFTGRSSITTASGSSSSTATAVAPSKPPRRVGKHKILGRLGSGGSGEVIRDPQQFVLCYGPAIRVYVSALLSGSLEAEEVLQNFLLRVVQQGGFLSIDPTRGRFRDYLRTCLRNAVASHVRRRQPESLSPSALGNLAVLDAADRVAEQAWLDEWRKCLLDKAWRELDRREQHSEGNLYYTVLRAAVDHRGEDSEELALRVSNQAGRGISPEAYRKQLSRARRYFAQALLYEVADTLDQANQDTVLAYSRDYFAPGPLGPE